MSTRNCQLSIALGVGRTSAMAKTNVSIHKQWLKTSIRHNSNRTTQPANISHKQKNNKLSNFMRVSHILLHPHASA